MSDIWAEVAKGSAVVMLGVALAILASLFTFASEWPQEIRSNMVVLEAICFGAFVLSVLLWRHFTVRSRRG